MQIRKFTRAASWYVKLQPGDFGRHVTDFATHVTSPELPPELYEKIEQVIAGSVAYSDNVLSRDSSRVLVHVPYLSNNKIKGEIVNFIELNEGELTD